MKKVILSLISIFIIAVFAYFISLNYYGQEKAAIIEEKTEADKPVAESNTKVESSIVKDKEVETSAVVTDAQDNIKAEAEGVLRGFIDALNRKDMKLLSLFVEGHDEEQIKMGMEYYNIYFKHKRISGFEFVKAEPAGEEYDYTYRIYNEEGRKKAIVLRQQKNKTIVGFDSFLYYAKYADRKVKDYVDSIKTKRIKRLGFDIWNSMEPVNQKGEIEIYPTSAAQAVLDKYIQNFDINSLQYEFTGEMTEEYGMGQFRFRIFGERNNELKEHEILVYHGDGQTGIIDEWVIPAEKNEVINPDEIN